MTLSAITRNKEWNTKIVSTEQEEMTQAILQEFDAMWKDEHTVAFEDFIDVYRQQYLNERMIGRQKRLFRYRELLLEKYHINMTLEVESSVLRNLRKEFPLSKIYIRRRMSSAQLEEKFKCTKYWWLLL